MNNKLLLRQQRLPFRIAVALMLHAMVIALVAPLQVMAVDIQVLPSNTAGVHGFTHAARVTWDDLNAADNAATIVQLGPIPTNSYVDRVAYYVEEPFTNTAAAGTNLTLSVGVAGAPTAFFNTNFIDGSSIRVANGSTRWMLSTNLLVPYKSTTSSNYVIASFEDMFGASLVDTYTMGKVRIYWRVVEPAKIKF
jgi:hypothetical protein